MNNGNRRGRPWRRRRWRPSVVELALVALLLAGLGAGARTLGAFIEESMAQLRDDTMAMLNARIGRQITYGRISPSLLRAFEIRDLTIFSANRPDEPLLSINRIRIRYSLTRLILARDPVAALREIQLLNSDFTVNLNRDQELREFLGQLSYPVRATPGAAEPADGAVDLSGANLGLVIEQDGYRLIVEQLFFRARAGDRVRITARGRLSARLPASAAIGPLLGGQLDAQVQVDGHVANDLSAAELSVRLDDLATPAVSVSAQELRFTLRDEVVQVASAEQGGALELALTHDPGTGRTELRYSCVALPVADLVTLHAPPAVLEPLLAAVVTGSGRVWTAPDSTGGVRYEADLQGRIPRGANSPPGTVAVRVHSEPDGVIVDRLVVDTERGGIRFTGDLLHDRFLPDGTLELRALDLGLPHRLDARMTITRDGERLLLHSDYVAIGATTVPELTVELRPATAESLAYHYRLAARVAQPAANAITARGLLNLAGGLTLSLASTVEGLSADHAYRLLTPESNRVPWLARVLPRLTLGAEIDATTDFRTMLLRRASVHLGDAEQPDHTVTFGLTSTERGLLIDRMTADWRGIALRGGARLTAAGNGVWELDTDGLTVNGESYELHGRLHPAGVNLTGSHELRVTATVDADGLRVRGAATRLPLPLPRPAHAAAPRVTLEFEGQVADDDWSLRSDRMVVTGIPLQILADARLELGFEANPQELRLTGITYRDSMTELQGTGSFRFSDGLGSLAGSGALALSGARENYNLALTMTGDGVDLTVQGSGLPLARLGELPVDGTLGGRARITGSLQQPRVSAELDLENGRLNADPVRLNARVELVEQVLTVHDLNAELYSHRLRGGTGAIDLNRGTLAFGADYRAHHFGDSVAARLVLRSDDFMLSLPESLADTPRLALADVVHAVLQAESLSVNGEPVPSWTVQFRLEQVVAGREPSGAAAAAGSRLRFNGGPGGAFSGHLQTDGGFALAVREPFEVRGTAVGSISKGQVDAQINLSHADTTMLNGPIEGDALEFRGGVASGNVRVVGPLNDPDMWGTIQVAGGSVTLPFTPDPVRTIESRLRVAEKLLTLESVSADTRLQGTAQLERWVPRSFILELETITDRGIRLESQFGPLRFDGYATGALTVTVDAAGVGLEGTVQAHSAEIFVPEVAGNGDPGGLRHVKLAVSTGRHVEFTWPSPRIPILRVPLKPGERIAIEYDGASGDFMVDGDVEVRGGELFYFNRQFLLREGTIGFTGDQIRFDPRVQVRAETRERDADGQDLRIILEADTTLNNLSPDTVRLSTDPPRSRVAIESLVRGGTAGEDGPGADATTAGSAAGYSGDLVAQVTLLRPVERALRELLGVDFVSIRSPFVQNLVVDRLLAPAGTTAAPGGADLLDNTSLSLGKYFGSDLFLKMLLRLETPELDVVDAAPIQPDLELSLEWETPFFLIEWSFLPQNAEALFVTDNWISVRWRVNY